MIQAYKPSRFHPCSMRFNGSLCNGTAILEDDKYTCDACGWQWNQDGTPITQGGNNV